MQNLGSSRHSPVGARRTFGEIAQSTQMEVGDILGILTRVVTYSLQTLVEQGISLLARLLLDRGIELNEGVPALIEHVKFSTSSRIGVVLATGGVRHRRTYVELGNAMQALTIPIHVAYLKAIARRSLQS